MRAPPFLLLLMPVILSVYWAYHEHYATKVSIEKVNELEAQIGHARNTLHWLNIEWNTLNSPERIMDLTDKYFDKLQLVKVTEANYGNVESIPLLDNTKIIFDVNSQLLLATQTREFGQ